MTPAGQARARDADGYDPARLNLWISVAVLLGASILIRLINLNHLPLNDELYTVLAARGWLTDGVPRIADGVYDRALLYTITVAQFFRAFGESLLVARLPSLIAGAALVVVVFLWTRMVAGNIAGWVAALFVCFSPLSIQLSQLARFYTIFALSFWLAAIGVYALTEKALSRRAAVGVAVCSLASLALAFHLQPLTVIGVLALGTWLSIALILRWLGAQRHDPRRLWTIAGLAIALLLIGSLVMVQTGLAQELWHRFRDAPLHAVPRDRIWFYQLAMIERYPTLWPILPFLGLLALAFRPRPALFCCVVFIASFALLSVAAMKHLNYIFFVLPFLFVVWAIAIAQFGAVLWRWMVSVADRAVALIVPGLPQRPTRYVFIGASLLFLAVSNGAPARTILKPFGFALISGETSIDWAPANAALQPWLQRASVVLTPDDMHALYYLGDYDIAVSGSRLSEFEGDEFDRDPRTGRPVISTTAALATVIDCYPSGLVVTDDLMYGKEWGIDQAKIILLHERARRVEAPQHLHAFFWQRPQEDRSADACQQLREHGLQLSGD